MKKLLMVALSLVLTVAAPATEAMVDTLKQAFPQAEVSETSEANYLVRLGADSGPVALPAAVGAITLDLNGHSVTGLTECAAIRVGGDEGVDTVMLTLAGTGKVVGGVGRCATNEAEATPGAAAIAVADGVDEIVLTIGAEVTVTGGPGGDAIGRLNIGAATGGCAVESLAANTTVVNAGEVVGGKGGDYLGTFNKGTGGAGGEAIFCDSAVALGNTGVVRGGMGGYGFAAAGDGGAAVAALSAVMIANDGEIVGGEGGMGWPYPGSGADAFAIDSDDVELAGEGTVQDGQTGRHDVLVPLRKVFSTARIQSDGEGGYLVKLNGDIGSVVLADNLGTVKVDLNGHSITGAVGRVDEVGGAAVTFIVGEGVGLGDTRVIFTGPGSIVGGRGANQELNMKTMEVTTLQGMEGGPAFFVSDDVVNHVSVTLGAGVSAVGGAGGDAFTASVVGTGGPVSEGALVLSGEGTTAKGGRGVVGFDDLLRTQFPTAVIEHSKDGYRITLKEISGPVTLWDNMGNVTIDLQGRAIRSGDASVFADAGPAVYIVQMYDPWMGQSVFGAGPTQLTFTGGGTVQGGNGADGTPNREPTAGGAAVALQRDVSSRISVTADAGVTLRGGDGGVDVNGVRAGVGGKAVRLGVSRLGAGTFIDGKGGERDLTEMIEPFFPASSTVECVAGGGHRVTLAEDVTGPLWLPDNLGKVTLDLNGHSIRGAAGAEYDDGGAAIVFMATYETLLGPTELVLAGSGLVAGGDGADGTESRSPTYGGSAVCADDSWSVAAVSVTVGAGVTLRGGDGGDGERPGEFGFGGFAVDYPVRVVANGGTVVDGADGTFDLYNALAAAFPATAQIARQTDGCYRVTLTEDVYDVVLVDNYGRVTVDLNGYAIRGSAATADSYANCGLTILGAGSSSTPLDLMLVGPGEVCGADGNEYNWDGTEAIKVDGGYSVSISVGEGVTVRGGDGASFVEDFWGGGSGQYGMALDAYGRVRIVNAGTIAGGRGGDSLGAGGEGGSGSTALCCWGDYWGYGEYAKSLVVTNLATGAMIGGDGGVGVWGGNGGKGFNATDFERVEFVNAGLVVSGAGGEGLSMGGAASYAVRIKNTTELDFTNAGTIEGGAGGAGSTGGDAHEVVYFDAVEELGFTNTGTLTGGDGGDGDKVAGTAANPPIYKNVTEEVRSETAQGTITPGQDGYAINPPIARITRLFKDCADVVQQPNGTWLATLTTDLVGLELPEDCGLLTIDLNGHAIRGETRSAAITVTAAGESETPLELSLVGPGSVVGGDGTVDDCGGEGILLETGVEELSIKVGEGVTVQGGKGWCSSDDLPKNAGDGGCGIYADSCWGNFTLTNAGTVAGGDGGDYQGTNPSIHGGLGGDCLYVFGGDGEYWAWGTAKIVNSKTGVIRSGNGGTCLAGQGGSGSTIRVEQFDGGVQLDNQGTIRCGNGTPLARLPGSGYEGRLTIAIWSCSSVMVTNSGDIVGPNGGFGGIWGGETCSVIDVWNAERVDFVNSGRITGGRAGDGGMYGCDGSSCVYFSSIGDFSFENTGTIKGIDGGDGGLYGGGVSETIARYDIANTMQYDTSHGTIVDGVPGRDGTGQTSVLLDDLFPGAEISGNDDDGWRIRLTADLQGVALPSFLGAVTIDLNGHAIRGENGCSAIAVISMDSDADSLTLSLVGPGLVAGGDGDKYEWDGGTGIYIGWGMEAMTLNVGEGVTVQGGRGWNTSDDPEAWSGGYGCPGIWQDDCTGFFTLENAGTIVGGDGGDCLGAGEYERNGGLGACGLYVYGSSSSGTVVATINNLATGIVRSGNGGNGRGQGGDVDSAIEVGYVGQVDLANHGQIVCGRAGDGGVAGGKVRDPIVFDNVGNVVEDETAGGTVAEGVPGGVNVGFRMSVLLADLIPGAEITLTDEGGCRVKLTADLVGLELPEDLGPVTIDLNGHAIRGYPGGHAIEILSVGSNETPLALSLEGAGTVVGGDGTFECEGGVGVCVDYGVDTFSLAVGEDVTVQGGNGWDASDDLEATVGGYGAPAVYQYGCTGAFSLMNAGTIVGGDGGNGSITGGGVYPVVWLGDSARLDLVNSGRIVGGRAGDGGMYGGEAASCVLFEFAGELLFENTGTIKGCDGGDGLASGGAAMAAVYQSDIESIVKYETENGTIIDGVPGDGGTVVTLEVLSLLFPGAEITQTGNDGWTIRLTADHGMVLLPDSIGAITIDLNGHTIRSTASENAAITVFDGGNGRPTELTLVGPGSVMGCDGVRYTSSSYLASMLDGTPAIQVMASASLSSLVIGENVLVKGGDGGVFEHSSTSSVNARGGMAAAGIDCSQLNAGDFTLENAGTIQGGRGGSYAGKSASGVGADGAKGVSISVASGRRATVVNGETGVIAGGGGGDLQMYSAGSNLGSAAGAGGGALEVVPADSTSVFELVNDGLIVGGDGGISERKDGATAAGGVALVPAEDSWTACENAGMVEDGKSGRYSLERTVFPALLAAGFTFDEIAWDDESGRTLVTLGGDHGNMSLPDNLGVVVIDLNGHTIGGNAVGTALSITNAPYGTSLELTLLGPGSVLGRDGTNGNTISMFEGGNAIQVKSNAYMSKLVVGEGVLVKGGDGYPTGLSLRHHGVAGGNAISYAYSCTNDFVLVNAGTIQGGDGGTYDGGYEDGVGEDGAKGISIPIAAGKHVSITNEATGVIAGGCGGGLQLGDGHGTSIGDRAGAGGIAVQVTQTSGVIELVNAGQILGGDGGLSEKGDGATAAGGAALEPTARDWTSCANTGTISDGQDGLLDRKAGILALLEIGCYNCDIVWDEANNRAVVTLIRGITSGITIPDNVGEVVLDLNGYYIRGTSSKAAITFEHPANTVTTPTHLMLVGKGMVTGYDAPYSKNSAKNGGAAFSLPSGTARVTVDIASTVTVSGGKGGDSATSPGKGGEAVSKASGVKATFNGVMTKGADGIIAETATSSIQSIIPSAICTKDDDGNWVITLTQDVGAVSIPDNLGPVTLDLNGHSIIAKGEGEDGLSFSSKTPKDLMTDLTIVGKGSIVGADGTTAYWSRSAGDGISIFRDGISVTVGPEVTVRGGKGGSDTCWGRGGEGGSGIYVGTKDVSITVYGTLIGGDGGDGDPGFGGDGGHGISVGYYSTDQYGGKLVNQGMIIAGDGGDGFLGSGIGGEALSCLDNYEIVNEGGETQDGVDGENDFAEMFNVRYPTIEVGRLDEYSILLTLTEDLHDTLVISMSEWITGHNLPEAYQSVYINLNGHSIYGTDGTAEHPDGGPGILCREDPNGLDTRWVVNAYETWLYVYDFTASSNSVVRGGNGYSMSSDGPAGRGGDGIAAQNKPDVIQFYKVEIIGGDGGDNTGSGDGGDGGNAIRGVLNELPVNMVFRGGNGGDAVSGNGGNGGDALGDYGNDWNCEFPGGPIWLYGGNGGNSQTGNGGNGGHGQHFDLYDGYNVPYMQYGAVNYFGGNGGSSVDGDGGDGGHGLWGYGCEWTMGTVLHGGDGGSSVNGNGGSGGDGLRGDGATLGTSWGGEVYYQVDEIPHEAVGGNGGESDKGMGGNGGNGVTYTVVAEPDVYVRWFGGYFENDWADLENDTTFHLELDSTGGAGADGFFRGIGGSSVVFGDDPHQGGDEVNVTAGDSDNGPDGQGKAWEFTVTGPGVLDWQNLIDDPWVANTVIGETNAWLTVSIDGGEPLVLHENDTAGEHLPERIVFGGDMDTVHTVSVRFHTSTTRIAPTRPSGSVKGWTFKPYGIDIKAPVTHPESEPFALANLGTVPAAEAKGKTVLNVDRLDTTANLSETGRQLDSTVNPPPTDAATTGTMDYWYVAQNPRSPDDAGDTLAMTAPTLSAGEPTSFTVSGIEGLSEFSWEMFLKEGMDEAAVKGGLTVTVVKTLDGEKTTTTHTYTAADLEHNWKERTFTFDGPTNAMYDVTFTYTNNSDGDGQALVDNIRWNPLGASLMIVDHEDPGDGYVYLAFQPQLRGTRRSAVNAWARKLSAHGLRAKRGVSRAKMETFAPTEVVLSDRADHQAATDRVWVKVPLAGLDQDKGYWRVAVDDAELSFKDTDNTLVDPPAVRSGPSEKDARSVNVFGIVKVASCDTNTLVAIPWTWYSAQEKNAADIPVDKLVKATNLTEGDLLLQHRHDGEHGDHYSGWMLKDGGWTPITTVTSNEVYQAVSGVDGSVAVRGYGLWLVRQRPVYTEGPDKGKAVPFWLYGQSIVRQEVSEAYGGTRTKPTYTMLGNPYCEPVRINDLAFEGEIGRDDRIIVPNGANASKYLEYKQGKGWRWARPTMVDGTLQNTYDYDVTIPAGTGFWYVRRTAGDLTVTWPMPLDN